MRKALALIAPCLGLAAFDAAAVPSFARQTDLDCGSCHLSWLELTPTGRNFKLAGYTWGKRAEPFPLPVAGMIQVARTDTRKPEGLEDESREHDRKLVLQEAAAFVAGKATDHAGGFVEITYEGIEKKVVVDNVDLRYARSHGEGATATVWGVTLHNNPTVQDIYNTGPAWGFPFAGSEVAVSPNAATIMESLGQQVAGIGAYAMWRKTLYAEITAYREARGAFAFLRAGMEEDERVALKGANPYWRLALQHEWDGVHSAMIGTYGMVVQRYPSREDPTGPTDRFRDVAFDAQYQYIGNGDHRASAQVNYIREKQEWRATPASNATDTLHTWRAKATYYYQQRYGVNIAYFSTSGSPDAALYENGEPVSGSATASPNTRGAILEFNWLPRRDWRFVAQYTAYDRFNGARNDYDGFGRNARDNNALMLMGWFMF